MTLVLDPGMCLEIRTGACPDQQVAPSTAAGHHRQEYQRPDQAARIPRQGVERARNRSPEPSSETTGGLLVKPFIGRCAQRFDDPTDVVTGQ